MEQAEDAGEPAGPQLIMIARSPEAGRVVIGPYDAESIDPGQQPAPIVCDFAGKTVSLEGVDTIEVEAQQIEPARLAQVMARLPTAEADCAHDGDEQLQFTLVRCMQYLKATETMQSCPALCREYAEQEMAPVQISLDKLSSDAQKIGGQSE